MAARHWILAPVLAALVACSGSGSGNDVAAPTSAPASSASTTTVTTGSRPTPTQPPGPPATRRPKAITFGPITFHAPADVA